MKEKAHLALGCFWEPDDFFSKQEGVISTTAGYAGGEKENPTYKDLGKHTETVEIEYDPDKISFDQLLDNFWKLHDPSSKQPDQYKSIIFTNDDEQKASAEKSLDAQRSKDPNTLTEIRQLSKFNPAEDYHQNYLQKRQNGIFE